MSGRYAGFALPNSPFADQGISETVVFCRPSRVLSGSRKKKSISRVVEGTTVFRPRQSAKPVSENSTAISTVKSASPVPADCPSPCGKVTSTLSSSAWVSLVRTCQLPAWVSSMLKVSSKTVPG